MLGKMVGNQVQSKKEDRFNSFHVDTIMKVPPLGRVVDPVLAYLCICCPSMFMSGLWVPTVRGCVVVLSLPAICGEVSYLA